MPEIEPPNLIDIYAAKQQPIRVYMEEYPDQHAKTWAGEVAIGNFTPMKAEVFEGTTNRLEDICAMIQMAQEKGLNVDFIRKRTGEVFTLEQAAEMLNRGDDLR